MKKCKRTPEKIEAAIRLSSMINPDNISRTEEEWIIFASNLAEKERQSMRELYLEKSGWHTFGEMRGE